MNLLIGASGQVVDALVLSLDGGHLGATGVGTHRVVGQRGHQAFGVGVSERFDEQSFGGRHPLAV